MSIKIYPYKQGSKSAKTLAEAVEGKVLKIQGSKFKPKAKDIVINWGSGNVPAFGPAKVLNQNAGNSSNKLVAFKKFSEAGVTVPEFWTKREELPEGVFPIVCRTKLTGHSGEGIVIANNKEELVDAPLYTKYVKKKDEYRVHIFNGEVIFLQRKARRIEEENPNWMIRNLANGFVFVETQEADTPAVVVKEAKKAIKALDMDFGGVDVVYNAKEGKAYVLEVNSACGLEERTAEKYAGAVLLAVAN